MSNRKDIERWYEYAKSRGWSVGPAPHERVFRKIGIEVRPALFWSPWAHMLWSGILFGVLWTLFMYFTVWGNKPILQIIIHGVSCGVLFGVGIAIFHRYQRRKLGLGTWENFVKSQPQ